MDTVECIVVYAQVCLKSVFAFPYQDGQHNGEKNWNLQSDWQVLEKSSEKVTNTLANVLQWLRDERGDGDRDGLHRKN